MSKNKLCFHSTNTLDIVNVLSGVSTTIVDHIKNSSHRQYSLWYKSLLHSDLANRGKRNGYTEGLEKNLLYYLTVDQMIEIEQNSKKSFESAKQSNIGLPLEFYEDIKVPRLQRRNGPQTTLHKHVLLNDYVDVFLVNDSLRFFTSDYTSKALSALHKDTYCNWINESKYSLDIDSEFTEISLHEAIHGLGTSVDKTFSSLRLNIFLGDTIYFLIEKSTDFTSRPKLFILLEKNPHFYNICGMANEAWTNYLTECKHQNDSLISAHSTCVTGTDADDNEKSRKRQSAWKLQLAKEMMIYTTHEGEVFCPFTYITAEFDKVPMLFIASHIKRYSDSESIEAYDINNGLLLCANADALFDKHMITITEKKQLKFSFLIERNELLKGKLLLNQPIFQAILNESRMKYLEDHRRIFEEKEKQRKQYGMSVEDEMLFEEYDSSDRNVYLMPNNESQQMIGTAAQNAHPYYSKDEQ